tara:strand:- start:225 stop:533 length:309 start_codon:yes stop_codon:yes gene_type:complete
LTLGGAAGGGAGSGALLEKKHMVILLILRLLVPQKHCLKIRLLNADHHAKLALVAFHRFVGIDWETFGSVQLISPLELRETFLKILYTATFENKKSLTAGGK